MNFFEHQARARSNSRWMVVLFIMSTLVIIAAINVVVMALFVFGKSPDEADNMAPAMIAATVITALIIGLGSLYKVLSLRRGGGSVARELGGTLVPEDPRDFHLKRLRNVVEEMSIASGVPVPEIYVLDREAGINAFAAGYGTADAAIAVTRGTLDRLSRDELQAVIAHEFSHVLNGDMRLNVRLMGLIFGLLVLGITGRKVLEGMRHGGSKKDGAPIFAIALAVMVFGYLGVFLGRMIKAYVSRQREFLADASAVQFTRVNHGLTGALMKIGAFEAGSKLTDVDGEEVAHMLFGDGVGYSALTATHPPIAERIRRVDPRFDPAQLLKLKALEPRFAGVDEDAEPPAAMALLAGNYQRNSEAPKAASAPQRIVAQVATPMLAHVEFATDLKSGLPPVLVAAAHQRDRAIDVVLALLLSRAGELRAASETLISECLGSTRRESASSLISLVADLPSSAYMPLALIALPAIKRRPEPELVAITDCLDALIRADDRIDVFEFALARLVRQDLSESRHPGNDRASSKLHQVETEAVLLLSVLAAHGGSEERAQRAFAAGMTALYPRSAHRFTAMSAHWPEQLDNALTVLDKLIPPAKESLVLALATTAMFDGGLTVEEAELLRLACAALHCPLPPVLA